MARRWDHRDVGAAHGPDEDGSIDPAGPTIHDGAAPAEFVDALTKACASTLQRLSGCHRGEIAGCGRRP